MEVPPHPATAMARRLAKPPHPSPPQERGEGAKRKTDPSPPDGGEETHGKPPLPAHPQVVITGSVNSSELTLFDPVIHA